MDLKNNYRYTIYSDIIAAYLNDIHDFAIISPSEEHDLFVKIRMGDEESRNKIITANQRFVFAVAKKYTVNNEFLLDLVNEGTIGLIKAIDTFDPTKGFRFISYAVWHIRREMNLFLINNGSPIRQSNTQNTYGRLNKLRNRFFVINGRYPSIKETVELFNKTYPDESITDERDVYDIVFESIDVNNFNEDVMTAMVPENSHFNVRSVVYNDVLKVEEDEANKFEVKRKFSQLDKREKKILELSFGFDTNQFWSNEEIGVTLNITGERVRQIKNHTIDKLRGSNKKKIKQEQKKFY